MVLAPLWLACVPGSTVATTPAIPEEPCNRVDENADGVRDPAACAYSEADADLAFEGITWIVPDLDGSGGLDLWLLEGHVVSVFDAVTLAEVFTLEPHRLPPESSSGFWAPTVGDFDGDGVADVGVTDAIYSAPRGEVDADDAVAVLVPPPAREWSYPFGADVDGDGVMDVVVSTADFHGGEQAWAPGPFSGEVTLDDQNLAPVPPLPPPAPGPAAPGGCQWLEPVGDYTGDGVGDWACGRRSGGTAVFDGADLEAGSWAEWPGLFYEGHADVDGDGFEDLVGKLSSGSLAIVAGGVSGRVDEGADVVRVELLPAYVVAVAELDGAPGVDLLVARSVRYWRLRGVGY